MPPNLEQLGIDRLSLEDQLALAEAIWDHATRTAESSPLTEVQRIELEHRLSDSIAHPERTIPWESVKERLLSKARD